MTNIILTSSFQTVVQKLRAENLLPPAPARVAFIPTAEDPYEAKAWMMADRDALAVLSYEIFEVDLKNKTEQTVLLKNYKFSHFLFLE